MTTAHTVITTVPVDSYPWAVAVSANGSAASLVASCSVVASIGFDRARGPGFSRETSTGGTTIIVARHDWAFAQAGKRRPGTLVGFCS
jgi:hypothetical protein